MFLYKRSNFFKGVKIAKLYKSENVWFCLQSKILLDDKKNILKILLLFFLLHENTAILQQQQKCPFHKLRIKKGNLFVSCISMFFSQKTDQKEFRVQSGLNSRFNL